jgi:HlyD family secretion protein
VKRLSARWLVLIALPAALIAGWYLTRQRPLAVEVVRPEANVEVAVFGLGTLEARVVSKIGFKLSNALVELTADQGARVKKGDVLARLDSAEPRARVAKSEAGLLEAAAAVVSAEAAIARAKAVVANKSSDHHRKQTLFANRTVSAEMLENARLDLDTANADLAIAESGLAAAQAKEKTARAQLELDKVALADSALNAPYDAVVVARHQELGTIVKAGEPLFTLVDPDSIWVLGYISENRAGQVSLGQTAEVRLRSRPHERYHGTVARIDIESDRVTEERRIYVTCRDCPAEFHLGEQAEVYVTTAQLEKALLVPENTVDDFDERQMAGTVWVVEAGELRKRRVVFGHRTLDARLSILSGLDADALVVARLPKLLREGRRAIVGEEAAR